MTLKRFVKKYVCKNTLIRLWYTTPSGYIMVSEKVAMDKEFKDSKGRLSEFSKNKVVGVADIVVSTGYTDAVNIVIIKK